MEADFRELHPRRYVVVVVVAAAVVMVVVAAVDVVVVVVVDTAVDTRHTVPLKMFLSVKKKN